MDEIVTGRNVRVLSPSCSPSTTSSSNNNITKGNSNTINSISTISSQYPILRAFQILPEQILRYILTFLNPRELSSKCVYVSKRFSIDSRRAAKTILDILSEKYRWVRLLMLERNQLIEDGYFLQDKTAAVNSIRENNSNARGRIFPSTINCLNNENNYDRKQIEKNIRSNVYILHILTTPSVISVGGNFEPKRVDSYDIVCNKWIELKETNVGREAFFEILWFQGFIYVFCGIHHSSYGSVERLNPLTNIWTKVTSLPGFNNFIFDHLMLYYVPWYFSLYGITLHDISYMYFTSLLCFLNSLKNFSILNTLDLYQHSFSYVMKYFLVLFEAFHSRNSITNFNR